MSAAQPLPPPVRVLIADDEELVREGLAAILGAQADLAVVGTAVDGDDAVEQVTALRPDVVLMDVRMPGTDGVEATRRIAGSASGTRVLILTTVEHDDVLHAALRAGASGFLLKSSRREQLWAGIRAVADGDALLSPSVTRRLIEAYVAGAPSTPDGARLRLTQRQADVVRLVARGLSNREIGERLFLAETTVKGYVGEVLAAHHLRDRTQLVVLAYDSGLVRPGGTD